MSAMGDPWFSAFLSIAALVFGHDHKL